MAVNIPQFLLVGVTLYIIARLLVSLQHVLKARRLGCKPPIRAFSADVTGTAMLFEGVKVTREKRMPSWMCSEFDRLTELHGHQVTTVKMHFPFLRTRFMSIDPAVIQLVLANNFKDFEISPNRLANFNPLLGNGIFASNGKQWEHSRALLRPQFVRSQINDTNLEEAHVKAFMNVLDKQRGQAGWSSLVDLQPLFFNLTLDSATEFLFGESVDSQTNGGTPFADAFDNAQHHIALGARMGSNYWMAHNSDFRNSTKNVHEFIDHFVQKALATKSDKTSDKPTDDDRYIFLEALAEQTQNPVELRNQLLNILLAGRDTTASTLGWFFFTMANPKNSAFFKRLRDVVLDEFGTYENPKPISFETMKSCDYLQWCVNEILRLYPVVPFNGRSATKDTVLPVGGGTDGKSPLYVKKGEEVAYSVHAMHRRKDVWGEDANEFRPERWEKRRSGWHYLPFNGGPRICIGQQFALTEVAYVIVRLMQRFDDIDGAEVGPVKHGLTLTNCPGEGVNVRLHFAEGK